ncbi:hypothetical protein OsJ_24283 [Oryza sativa Japonica Group]|uniref:Uncharacterized protein n=1 Tax=Oryza sativa subsp. japonica TaxID=39947 RepID=Q6YZR7_ORYSJ|nr:hypothetical protein OsJ_24283 [Oryza sativa Japonica Group]BAC57711.1 hypothetical protein [Oryza sativa Japonica Group]BAC84367.1 hypothetical protein [Oryza sativa Japonica Group]BAD31524.1 hypothetical protein [Oryza sativa Japonica Group]
MAAMRRRGESLATTNFELHFFDFFPNPLSFPFKQQGARCYLWIWEDLLREYVEEIVAYCHAGEFDSLWETCDELRWQLLDVQGRNIELCSILEAKEAQLQLYRDELNQSKREVAEMKHKMESEKAMLQWVLYMLMFICVLCVSVVVGKNYLG